MYKVTVNKKEFRAEFDRNKMEISGKKFETDILEYKEGKFHILRDNKSISAELVEMNLEEKTFLIKVNNNIYSVIVRDKYDELLREMGIDSSAGKKLNDIKAPMPGLVLNVLVENGQSIQKGDGILILDAETGAITDVRRSRSISSAATSGSQRYMQVMRRWLR